MRFTRSDVRDISFHPKSTTDLPSSAEKRRSSRKVHRSTFARFLGSFDFRLLQQYLPRAAYAMQQIIARIAGLAVACEALAPLARAPRDARGGPACKSG